MTQTSLLEPQPSPASSEPPDLWSLLATTRGVAEGWRWYKLETADHKAPRHQSAALVTGAVCLARFKSGPRNGELNWAKRDKSTERTLVIPFPEFDAFMANWEAEHKACSSCGGAGQYRSGGKCHGCKGSGLPRPLRTP